MSIEVMVLHSLKWRRALVIEDIPFLELLFPRGHCFDGGILTELLKNNVWEGRYEEMFFKLLKISSGEMSFSCHSCSLTSWGANNARLSIKDYRFFNEAPLTWNHQELLQCSLGASKAMLAIKVKCIFNDTLYRFWQFSACCIQSDHVPWEHQRRQIAAERFSFLNLI